MGVDVFYSYNGKSESARLYAHCAPVEGQNVEDWAFSLWYDLRRRQREDGQKETAAVWIGNKKFKPTVEQIEAYEEKLRKMKAEAEFLREGSDVEVDECEQAVHPRARAAADSSDSTDEDDEGTPEVDWGDGEDDVAADSGDTVQEAGSGALTSIMLEDEDDLDF